MENYRSESYINSNFYEQMAEHVFISEILQEAWFRYKKVVEVLRAEIDASGYDIVLECNGYTRHIQLKTSFSDASRKNQNINVALAEKPSGCVIWLLREEDNKIFRVKLKYLFFGDNAGNPLPSLEDFKTGKHTKADSQGVKGERKSIRVVPKGKFIRISCIKELLKVLFGLE